MQFQRIHVQNWRCFTDESVRFEDGVTVLYGNNGSGKSSLLEAAFFALYGSDALETGTTLDDVVTTDEDTAKVTLSFAHRGESYEVTREIRIRASTTQSADLTTPPGQPDLSQIKAIDELIQEELRLNAEDFLNSAYVQQGDVSRLIDATPTQRQRIIDNLLQMSKLERYRSRMDDIETGVGRVVETKEDQVAELTGQIDEYDESQIRARQRQLRGFESDLDDTRDALSQKIESLEGERSEAEEIVNEQEMAESTVDEAREAAGDRMGQLATAVVEYQSLQEDHAEATSNVDRHREEIENLQSVGETDLKTDYATTEEVVDAVTARATDVVSDELEEVADGSDELESDLELEGIANSVLDQVHSEDGGEDGSGADSLLGMLSLAVPPVTAAVTGASLGTNTSTIGTTEAIDEADLDPLINPEVEVDVSAVQVPIPGIESDPSELELSEAEQAQDETRADVSDIRERLQEFEKASQAKKTESDRLIQDADSHDRQAQAALDDASSTLSEIANIRQSRAVLSDTRSEFEEEIDASPFTIDVEETDPVEVLHSRIDRLESQITRLEAERDHYRDRATKLGERIEQADRLLAEGNCPECGRPVEGAPNVEHQEEWIDDRTAAQKKADALSQGITELTDRRDVASELLETARDLYGDELTVSISGTDPTTAAIEVDPKTDLTPLHEQAAEQHLSAREERKAAHDTRVQAVGQYISAMVLTRAAERTLAHLLRGLAKQDLLSQLEGAIDRRSNAERDQELAETKLDTQAAEVTDSHATLQEAITEHSKAVDAFEPETLKEAEETVAEILEELDSLEDDLDEVRKTERAVSEHLGDLGQRLTQLDNLREKRDTRQREATAVEALNSQITDLEEMFVNLRSDLREQNVQRLEELLQEMFETLYRNDAYADIKLNRDYDATLIEKGGGELPPTKLSGGESAVFNLALRGAIYRLLTEGFEDDVPLPPLILDEPTAHLDEGHVDRLNDVVDAMRTAGVKQTIVVSHDEGLIDSADHRIHVHQKQGTNRSVAEPESTVPAEF